MMSENDQLDTRVRVWLSPVFLDEMRQNAKPSHHGPRPATYFVRRAGLLAGWLDAIKQAPSLLPTDSFFISCAIELYRMVKLYVERATFLLLSSYGGVFTSELESVRNIGGSEIFTALLRGSFFNYDYPRLISLLWLGPPAGTSLGRCDELC
jgi:hypothetical protein